MVDIRVGRSANGDRDLCIRGDQRVRGVVVVAQPGAGKSTLLNQMALQSAEAGEAILMVDPHDGIVEFLRHCPKERRDDVRVLSLTAAESPMWPVLDITERSDEYFNVANLLVASWRAQHGEFSIGPRAASMLTHALKLIRPELLSPIELLSTLLHQEYRFQNLMDKEHVDRTGLDWPLELYWRHMHGALTARGTAEWASVIQNKLSVLVVNDWLRRATTGTPPSVPAVNRKLVSKRGLEYQGLRRAVWTRDGTIVLQYAHGEPDQLFNLKDELESYLLRYAAGGVAASDAFVGGMPARTLGMAPDVFDDTLKLSDKDETANHPLVAAYIARRRRRRAWSRFADFDLRERGVSVKEAFNVADLLDDGKIVLVEVPSVYGDEVQGAVATYVLMAALLRGLRTLSLPQRLRVPVAVYVDEAELFLTAGIERTLEELRKANVALTLAVQRLGQFGSESSEVRRAVVDTVGTTIALTPGPQEAAELAELLNVPKEDLLANERGHGFISGLTAGWARDKTEAFTFEALAPTEEDFSGSIRAASIERHYQSPEEADAVFKERVDRIRGVEAEELAPGAGAGSNGKTQLIGPSVP